MPRRSGTRFCKPTEVDMDDDDDLGCARAIVLTLAIAAGIMAVILLAGAAL